MPSRTQGKIVLWAICEHVEDAGVHSGDATLMLPPQTVPLPIIHKARKIAAQLAEALAITGPFNLQLLVKHGRVRVIECNLRASRSLPFVSKVTGNNFVREAMRRMLGVRTPVENRALDLDYVAVKAPQFSFPRLVGADPMLGVEMASTGEVGCFGDDGDEALLQALSAIGFQPPRKGVLLSLGPAEREVLLPRGGQGALGGSRARAVRHGGHRRGARGERHRVHGSGQGRRAKGGAAWTSSMRVWWTS